MGPRKRIALIAHDNRKSDLLDWARHNCGANHGTAPMDRGPAMHSTGAGANPVMVTPTVRAALKRTKGGAAAAGLGVRLAALCSIAVAVLLSSCRRAPPAVSEARVLRGIVIDGELHDWPSGMQRYVFRNRPGAQFRVGYDPDRNVLLVAVEVPDTDLVVGSGWHDTDACELDVWGGGGPDPSTPVQYALVPGPGEYIAGCGNPSVSAAGEVTQGTRTRTQAAYTYDGTTIAYEWAVEVHDRLPDAPARLTPGRSIGFDVVVVDKESNGHHNWIPWGSPGVHKFERPENLGRLLLLRDPVLSAPP